MDITLRDYLQLADDAHEYANSYGITTSSKLEEKVHQLQGSIKNIQAVAKRMADVSNIINQLILHKKTLSQKTHTALNIIDPYPEPGDHAVLRAKYIKENEKKEILNGIELPIKIVEKESEIPIGSIYYISNVDQYAINVAGVNIKGNLSNIVEYQKERSARCEYGIECKSFKNGTSCNYWHDPEDYLKLGMKIPANNTRNFTVGSWLYSKNKKPKTYFTRHIGSKDTLLHDLAMLPKIQYREEISNREGQLIHDLLLYMILHKKGFLERYVHW